MLRNKPLTIPVLFLIFNRPDTTQKVFDEIRKARPYKLFVSADGPRKEKTGDVEKCLEVRDIIKQVDWECEVHTNFHENNVGLKTAISSAIDWFFDHVESGIILEDDCLPSQSFFWFCQELLEKYRDDERIMQISGNNFLFGKKVTDASYYFSKLNDIWGWATWRRAWKLYDINMKTFPQFKEQDQLKNYINNPKMRNWLMSYFEQDYHLVGNRKGLWSSQWAYAICSNNGLTIVPSVNLVMNIGTSENATHQADSYKFYSDFKCHELTKIVHPSFILPNHHADELRFDVVKKTDPRLLYAKRERIKVIAIKYLPRWYITTLKSIVNYCCRNKVSFID